MTTAAGSRASRAIGGAIVSVLLIAGCTGTPPSPLAIEKLVFHQYQAILDFDDSEYTQDDPAEIARFQELLDTYDVVPGVTVTTVEDECAGGLSTSVEVVYVDATSDSMFIASCGEPRYDEFNTEANELFSQWRDDLDAD